MGNQRANITYGQLVALAPSVRRELRSGINSRRRKKDVSTKLVEAEVDIYSPQVDVVCNGLHVKNVLVDGGSAVNVISEGLLETLGLRRHRKSNVTLGMANKVSVKPEGVVTNVVVSVMGVSTALDFQIMKKSQTSYPMLLGRPWLKRVHAKEYWSEGYMTIGRDPHKKKIPISPTNVISSESEDGEEDEYDSSSTCTSESEVDTDMEEETEVDLHALSVIPKAGPSNEKHTLSDEEIEERLQPIQFGEDIDVKEKEKFMSLFQRYAHLFAVDYKHLKQVTMVEHQVELVDNATPAWHRPYRMNPNFSELVKQEIDKLLHAGFIFPVEESDWVSPIVISPKKNGKLRVCVNFKKLNAVTKKDHYPIPFSDQILDEVAGHEWYSFGDGYSGYNQIRIAEKDQLKTTFTTPWGTFAYRVMPFGLCNAPATFQRFMNRVFEPFIGHFVRVFLDDFCVYGKRVDHMSQVERVLERLDRASASLNPSKCKFGCTRGILLGHIVSCEGITTDPDKVSKIVELPFPTTRSKLRSFLGHVGYYRRFVKGFAHKSQYLSKYLKKECAFDPDEDAEKAFIELKEALTMAPVLKSPDWSKNFLVYTDASANAVGSTLSQNDDEGHDHPIHFASRQLIPAERNYTVTEREALAIIFAVKKFRHYLLGNKFVVITDHQALKFIINKPNPTGRIARWILLLQEYEFEVVDRPGVKHINADALSRAYDEVGEKSEDDDFPDASLFALEVAPVEYKEVWDYLTEYKFPDDANKKKRQSIAHRSRPFSVIGNKLYHQSSDGVFRKAVSSVEGKQLLKEFHEGLCGGHYAGKATAQKILAGGYFWPSLFKDAHAYCRTCDICQSFANRSTTQAPLHPIPPLGPFEKWGIDIVGPLFTTSRGNRFLVVATDYLTKWSEARPLKEASAEEISRFIYERIVTQFGCPKEMVTDQGTNFLSNVIKELMERFSIKHRVATTYKPSTNGLVERTNQTLCRMIAKDSEVQQNKSLWDKKVHAALWSYRGTPNSSTGFTPFRLVYGVEGMLPVEYDIATWRTAIVERLGERESLPKRLLDLPCVDEYRDDATRNILKAQFRQKKAFDARVKTKVFEKGDLVKEFDARHHKRVGKKLLPRWFGPYRVKEAHYDNGTYELEELDGTYSHWVNQDKLAQFHVRDG